MSFFCRHSACRRRVLRTLRRASPSPFAGDDAVMFFAYSTMCYITCYHVILRAGDVFGDFEDVEEGLTFTGDDAFL
jgi:hypothetical protein